MSETLKLPGSIPGLLRRGSPVWVGLIAAPCVVLEADENEVMCAWDRVFTATPGAVSLDLTDATGRAHAAWWLAGTGHAAPTYRWARGGQPSFEWCPVGARGATLAGWSADGTRIDNPNPSTPTWRSGARSDSCPTLADLDPDDPRLLPDGSRWVDAEALRRVVLHVAGVPDAR